MNSSIPSRASFAVCLLLSITSCSPQSAAPLPQPVAPAPAAPAGMAEATTSPIASASAVPSDERGGRLYDNWRAEKELGETFTADSSETPALDGSGGPNGNGTLNDQQGAPTPNTGHDYRLKNLFGWDMRGAEGVYGPDYQKKPYVLTHNLLSDTRSPGELREWFAKGGDGLPAFGAVLDDRDLDDLVAFVVKTRDKELIHPEAVFKLDASAPKGFVLNSGGDALRGKELYRTRCAECHADDGRKIAIDEVESVGTLSRAAGYEIWFKLAHGQPGTAMDRQLTEPSAAAQAQAALDLFAALCDRKAFPPLATGKDVPNGDPRCGGYLR